MRFLRGHCCCLSDGDCFFHHTGLWWANIERWWLGTTKKTCWSKCYFKRAWSLSTSFRDYKIITLHTYIYKYIYVYAYIHIYIYTYIHIMYMNSASITINIGEGLYPSASDFRFLSVRFVEHPKSLFFIPPKKTALSTQRRDSRLAIFHLLDPLELHFGKPVFLPCRLGHLPSAKNHLKEVLQWTADIFFGPTSRRGWGRRCFFQNLLSVRFAEACFF